MPDRPANHDMADQPALVRLGHHAIELGKAAAEIDSPPLSEAVQVVLIEVGREIARSVARPKEAMN